MSKKARRHIAPITAILSNEGAGPGMLEVGGHTYIDVGDQLPNDTVHTVGEFRSTTIGDLIKDKFPTFPDTRTRLVRGYAVVED